jgi:hypothetical protein
MRSTEGAFPFWHFGSRGARRPVSSVIFPVVLPSPPAIAIVPKVLVAHKLENSRSDPKIGGHAGDGDADTRTNDPIVSRTVVRSTGTLRLSQRSCSPLTKTPS